MSESIHPILGALPTQVTPSGIPMMDQRVPAIASRTDPLPYVEIPADQETAYYTCRVPNHHMIRTDGKKLAFIEGVLATRDQNDIVYMRQVLVDRNPFVRAATEEEIKIYKMRIDPEATIRKQMSGEVEAEVQAKLSEKLHAVLAGVSLSEEDKAKLLSVLPDRPSVVEQSRLDALRIAGVDKRQEGPSIKMDGATAIPLGSNSASIQASLVGTNKIPNAAASNKTGG